jgi:hypothetical protein
VGEDFNPTAIRDGLNAHLPYPEVIEVARSKQGNLVVTCRNAAETVLKCQHLWMPGLPPVKRVRDEDRWARRVLYLKQPCEEFLELPLSLPFLLSYISNTPTARQQTHRLCWCSSTAFHSPHLYYSYSIGSSALPAL